jgi:hypothetical protein
MVLSHQFRHDDLVSLPLKLTMDNQQRFERYHMLSVCKDKMTLSQQSRDDYLASLEMTNLLLRIQVSELKIQSLVEENELLKLELNNFEMNSEKLEHLEGYRMQLVRQKEFGKRRLKRTSVSSKTAASDTALNSSYSTGAVFNIQQ